VSTSRLKYYFAVDTSYVGKKLGLLLFPFLHSVSSLLNVKLRNRVVILLGLLQMQSNILIILIVTCFGCAGLVYTL
jgi:hypothetical protein